MVNVVNNSGVWSNINRVFVTYEMLRRGYSETDIRKVLGENFLRAFAQAEKVANINSRKISGDGSLKKIK